jgi:isopentenyl-diphosphate delta-isomerase
MDELWQLYDEQGRPLAGKGATKKETFSKGLLHAAAHVWIWRLTATGPEVLLQKRAANKTTWPNCYDISAAGHIDLDEAPLAAGLRESQEEIGLDIAPEQLQLFSVQRAHLRAGESVENEFQWLYLLRLDSQHTFAMQTAEVDSVAWKPLADFAAETRGEAMGYVPHGELYYDTVIDAIEHAVEYIEI